MQPARAAVQYKRSDPRRYFRAYLVGVLVCAVEVLQVVEQHLNGVDLLAKLLVDLKRLLKQAELNGLVCHTCECVV